MQSVKVMMNTPESPILLESGEYAVVTINPEICITVTMNEIIALVYCSGYLGWIGLEWII